MTDDILRRLHFRELALRFLDSYNPEPDNAIVIADAILSYDGLLDESRPMRHMAHHFVREAAAIIEHSEQPGSSHFSRWLGEWNQNYGIL